MLGKKSILQDKFSTRKQKVLRKQCIVCSVAKRMKLKQGFSDSKSRAEKFKIILNSKQNKEQRNRRCKDYKRLIFIQVSPILFWFRLPWTECKNYDKPNRDTSCFWKGYPNSVAFIDNGHILWFQMNFLFHLFSFYRCSTISLCYNTDSKTIHRDFPKCKRKLGYRQL